MAHLENKTTYASGYVENGRVSRKVPAMRGIDQFRWLM
jgi:hypothetical protein